MRNVLNEGLPILLGAAILVVPSDALARNLVVKVWRGETHAMALPDDVRPGEPKAGIAFLYGSAQEIKYLTDTDKRQMASCLDKVTWDGGKGAQQISQGVIGGLQGLQSIGSGVADTIKGKAEYNQAVASAEVKRADARLKEVKEFLQQNTDEIQDLAERMEAHFRAYRGLIASKASTLLHLAENI